MSGFLESNPTHIAEIGGYFALELPEHGEQFPGAGKFQSARAALRALFEEGGTTRVLLPAYICDAVIQAAMDAGTEVEFYRIDQALRPLALPDTLPDRWVLLYVNYFGLCGQNVLRLRERYPAHRLIVDNSQALLAAPVDGAATVYSPRKFVGVPDGGLLMRNGLPFPEPSDEDTESVARMRHLLTRMASSAQDGYASYLEAERSLVDTQPRAMSRLTRRLLTSIDMRAVARRRRKNFALLAERLGARNQHQWELEAIAVPLCYPLVLDRDVESIRQALARKGIYIPTYWHEVNARVADSIEHRLTNCCLMVPCDQRYGIEAMHALADALMLAMGE